MTSLSNWEWIIEIIDRCWWPGLDSDAQAWMWNGNTVASQLSKDGVLCSKVRTFINVEDLDFGTHFEKVLILQTPLILFWGIYWIKGAISRKQASLQIKNDFERHFSEFEPLLAQRKEWLKKKNRGLKGSVEQQLVILEEFDESAEQLRLLDKVIMEMVTRYYTKNKSFIIDVIDRYTNENYEEEKFSRIAERMMKSDDPW